MSMILNPRPDSVVAKFDGAIYHFRGNERKEILNTFAARHIANRWGKYGLVDITPTDKILKRYQDYELYVHERAQEGLLRYQETLLETLQSYENYDLECGDKKTVERLRYKKLGEKVRKEIQDLKRIIEQSSKIDTKKILKSKVEDLLKQAAELQQRAKELDGNNTGQFKSGSAD